MGSRVFARLAGSRNGFCKLLSLFSAVPVALLENPSKVVLLENSSKVVLLENPSKVEIDRRGK